MHGRSRRAHRTLGPGLLEGIYSRCLTQALRNDGLLVRREVPIAVQFEGIEFPAGLRLDLLVQESVVVEVKAVDTIHPVHVAHLLSYLRLGGKPLGLLINFHVPLLHAGIRRFAMTR